MTVKTYQKQPLTIRAVQFVDNPTEIRDFVGVNGFRLAGEDDFYPNTATLFVAANDAWLPLPKYHWVASDASGFYPIDPDRFNESYKEASV